MLRASLLAGLALAVSAAMTAGATDRATVTCGALSGQTVELMREVRFLDRSRGWWVRGQDGRRTVLRERCLDRPRMVLGHHRCGMARGHRVAVLRYIGALANRRDPAPMSLTSVYEIAFVGEDGRPVATAVTELAFRACLTLDPDARWPEPVADR